MTKQQERKEREARKGKTAFAPSAVFAFLIFFPLAVFAAYRLTPPIARLDDAYIALHSARVVLSGHDPVFEVPALVGATSPAYVALLTALLAAGISNGDTALRIANALGVVAFAAAAWYLAGTVRLSLVRRLAFVVIAVGSGIVLVFNLTNGLETGWALATLTFAIACARAGRVRLVAGAAGVLPFIRPDLAPASAILLLYSMRGRRRGEQAAAVLGALIVALPWLVWMRWDTGMWITNTTRAKQLFYAEGCRPWIDKAVTVLRATVVGSGQMFPLCLGLWALGRDRLGRAGLAAIALSVFAYFVAFPGALEQPYFRYLTAIVVPWLCLGVALSLPRVPSPVAAGAAIAVLVAQLVFGRDYGVGFSREIKDTAAWIDAHVPPDAVLLVHDAGGVSEFAHRRAIDLVGLKTPSSMAAHARWTWPSCVAARGTAVSAIARESGADYFVAVSGWDESLRPDLTAGGFVLTPIRGPADGRRGYTVYRMERPAQTRER